MWCWYGMGAGGARWRGVRFYPLAFRLLSIVVGDASSENDDDDLIVG